MHFLYSSFKPYCERNGVKLLRDDMKYIETQLIKVPENAQRKVMNEYLKKWQEGIAKSKNSLLGQNFGRRMANLWLRDALDFDKQAN